MIILKAKQKQKTKNTLVATANYAWVYLQKLNKTKTNKQTNKKHAK